MRRRGIVALLVGVVIAVCIAFLDRPIALWSHERFSHTGLYFVVCSAFLWLDWLLLFAGFLLGIGAVWTKWRGNSPRWIMQVVTAGVATAVTLVVTVALKFAIGRAQVDPTFLQQHDYGFRPLAFVPGYGSFPSATMSGVAAFATGLGLPQMGEQVVLVCLVVLSAAALLLTNGHWLGDIVGGVYLGTTIGPVIARRWNAFTSRGPHRA